MWCNFDTENLTPWKNLSWKANVSLTDHISCNLCSLSFHHATRWTQSTSCHPASLRSIWILSSQLRLHLSLGSLLSGCLTKILYARLFFLTIALCPAHLIIPNVITQIVFGEGYKSWRCSLCSLFPVSCYFLPLRSNNFVSTL